MVLAAIHGHDGLDPTAVDRAFDWPTRRNLDTFRIGYVEDNLPIEKRNELQVLRELGARLVPIKLPSKYPITALTMILDTEAAAVFDELTRQGITEGLNDWPRTFRRGQFVPAVEYLRANRVRTLLMREMEEVMSGIDLYVGGNDLVLTNLTGHPTVVLPNGTRTARRGADAPGPDLHRPTIRRGGASARGRGLSASNGLSSAATANGPDTGGRRRVRGFEELSHSAGIGVLGTCRADKDGPAA